MALDLARIRGLCFDLDGTLSDSDDVMVARFARRLTPFRSLVGDPNRVAREIVMRIESPGNTLMGLTDRIGLDAPLAWIVDRFNRMGPIRKRAPLLAVPGVQGALARLQPHYPLALVSARDAGTTLAFLEQFELLEFFPVIATALTCQHTKPYPDPVHWAAGKMGLSAGECVMIGDTTVDIRAGRAAGAQTVGVLCGFGEESELTRAGADLILASTTLLPEVLLEAGK